MEIRQVHRRMQDAYLQTLQDWMQVSRKGTVAPDQIGLKVVWLDRP